MIEVDNNNSYAALKWVTPTMQSFVDNLSINGIGFHVGLIPAGYYATPEHCKLGPFGYIGGLPQNHVKESFSESSLTLMFTAKLSKDASEKDFEHLTTLLQITPGGHNNTLKPLTISEVNEYKTLKFTKYIYKKPGFDEALEALRFMDATIDANTLIFLDSDDGPNFSFVYESDEALGNELMTVNRNKTITTHVCNKLYIEIIATDIEKNKDVIIDLLTLASTMTI